MQVFTIQIKLPIKCCAISRDGLTDPLWWLAIRNECNFNGLSLRAWHFSISFRNRRFE